MTKISFFVGFVIFLILNSCQIRQKDSINTIDTKDSIDSLQNFKTLKQLQLDTLTVQDRRLEGGDFHSHIKLDFAKSPNRISDTSQIRLIDKICAVSIIPDTSWINMQQRKMGDDWNEVLSDNHF